MSWHQCRTCGWWQKQRGACIGCSRSGWSTWPSSVTSKTPKPKLEGAMPVPTAPTLQQRWQAAKQSSMDPRHLKIEVMCTRCFTRSLTARPLCRSCSHPMQDCYKVVPGQWPPIGATTSIITQYEGPVDGPAGTVPATTTQDVPMPQVPPPAVTAPTAADSALANLTTTQLRQEISRMDRHLQELPSDVFSSLRLSIEQSLQQAREELVSRRPEGQLLDQAIARHKHSLRARQLAETRQKQALEDLRLAETSLEQATSAEESAQLEVARLRQQISDAEAAPAVNPGLPAATLTALSGLLQQAGLPLDQLAQVAKVVGAPPPPPPPSAAPVPPTLPTQLDHPGSQSAPPPGVFTQLLATPATPLQPPPPSGPARTGRSPGRRPLPARSNLVDMAETARNASQGSRSASRTPDRASKESRHDSPPSPKASFSLNFCGLGKSLNFRDSTNPKI